MNLMQGEWHSVSEGVRCCALLGGEAWGLEELVVGRVAAVLPAVRARLFERLEGGRRFSQTNLEEEHCRLWRWLAWLRQREQEKSIRGKGGGGWGPGRLGPRCQDSGSYCE